MTTKTWSIAAAFVSALTIPATVAAQKLDQAKPFEAGDKSAYNWVLNNKAQKLEEEWTGVVDGVANGVQRAGGKEYQLVVPKPGTATQGLCLTNGQPCTFSPGVTFVDFPLEEGKKWTQSFTVKGDTFTSQVQSDYEVEKAEKVKTPAGEFESFRISHNGRIRGSDAKGAAFSGKEDGRYWVTLVNGKLAVVKIEYRNSFGEKFTREATSIAYK